MATASLACFLVLIFVYLKCVVAVREMSVNRQKELICQIRCNATDDKCGVKPDLKQLKYAFSKMEKEITRMNAALNEIKEKLDKKEDHDKRLEAADAVYSSCQHILWSDGSARNGVYRIKTKTPAKYSNVYCQMTSLPGCPLGGWTLVMKIDGNKETFAYSSSYWSNMRSYSPTAGETGLDKHETKLPTYWSTPFHQLCVGMKIANSLHFIPISYSASSLYDVLASGIFHPTFIPYAIWKSLYTDSSLQTSCRRQGFNVVAGNRNHARVRIGIIGNNEGNCRTADSFLGFGGIGAEQRRYCYVRGIVNSCGNSAYCSPDNGDKEVKAMGYIFVR